MSACDCQSINIFTGDFKSQATSLTFTMCDGDEPTKVSAETVGTYLINTIYNGADGTPPPEGCYSVCYDSNGVQTVVDIKDIQHKEVYLPDNGVLVWDVPSGPYNVNASVDLNTIAGIVVPSDATHVITHSIFNSDNVANIDVTIQGRIISRISTLGGHTQHVVESVIPLSGSSINVDISSGGNSRAEIYVLGFKKLVNF